MENSLDINANTKIGALLEAYPQLEDVLLRLSPSFAKLKNPVLRKTVGRIASIRQAAEIGGVNLGEMILALRKAAGMESPPADESPVEEQQGAKLEWVNPDSVSLTFDARPVIDGGGSPMKDILEKAGQLNAGEILLLITSFVPAPIIELLNSKGFRCWTQNSDSGEVNTYIIRAVTTHLHSMM